MKETNNKFKESFESRKFKSGAYSTIVTAIVIIIIIIMNLFAGELDIKVDLSSEKLFTLSEQTKEIVKSLTDEITIYQIVQSGNEDVRFTEILDKYAALSGNIKVLKKDPVLYPTFTTKYVSPTEGLSQNSLIVECGERYKVIPHSDMLVEEFNMTTYSNDVIGIDVEGQVTGAIMYVTSQNIPVMYVLDGHGEVSLPEQINSSIAKENVDVQTLNLLTSEDGIPEDTACILINAPQYDYSEDEINQIIEYLKNGGNAIILAGYTPTKLTNFESLLEYYGVQLAEGIVVEGNTSYYMSGRPTYVVPKISVHDITSPIKSGNLAVITPLTKGIQQIDAVRKTLKITSLLNTSSDAYSIVDMEATTYDKSEGDIDGPFDIAVAITEESGGNEAKLVIFGTYYFLDEQIIALAAAGNSDMFLNTVSWMADQESSISIRTRSVTTESLSLTSSQIGFWVIGTVIVIPLLFLTTGVIVWLRRRKK